MPQNKAKLIKVQPKAHEKVQISPQKSPSSLSDSTDQKSNLMMIFSSSLLTLKLSNGQNLKLNIGRESVLSSTKQAPIQMDTEINKSPTKLRQEIVLNKS